ncbi:flagellin [Bacillus infantis]|uniref:flagellin N-terminal helical domain-containing protein n=1 Tax=Bacillus infantis TaxID=324767 RepID=UPI003CF419A9
MIIKGGNLSLNLNNRIKKNQSKLGKTMEKLASGQRIRTAANDAAGLAISQKLHALARGSGQAIRNVQDAGSMVQVADGAMQEMTKIIHRIRELTVQSMNGTNTSVEQGNYVPMNQADTLIIQNEIDELKKELNHVVHDTEFNTIKLLTNEKPGQYIYENRSAMKTINLMSKYQGPAVDVNSSRVLGNSLGPVSVSNNYNRTEEFESLPDLNPPKSYIGTTVRDYNPQWSSDGQTVIFTSSRDNGQYAVSAMGGADPVSAGGAESALPQQTSSKDGLMRLRYDGTYLNLERRSSTGTSYWSLVRAFSDGSSDFSFSPIADASGNTSFAYSDSLGNIKRVDVNTAGSVSNYGVNLITTGDTLNIPPQNNTITMPDSPDLYRMNTSTASLKVYKATDSTSRELTYWDGQGDPPAGGYYQVSGSSITFYGDAIIGNEAGDDAQDYYSFSYVSDSSPNNIHTVSLSSYAEVYNMHGESGPRSLDIKVGGVSVDRSQLLSSRPSDVEGTTGVYVDAASGKVEFYGDLRPSYNQSVSIEHFSDSDGRNQIYSLSITNSADTYNLENSDLSAERSLRVYVGGNEVKYDASKTNGYTYDSSTGKISIYGDSRPDVPSGQEVKVQYIYDTSNTTKDVYGIPLGYRYPELYNLETGSSPSSLKVLRNGSETIEYSAENGYQYNKATNTIELYGTSRPNIGDTYSVYMVAASGGPSYQDEKVEVKLSYPPETYGADPASVSSAFKVMVDGTEVQYDAAKTNGYFYNKQTNNIELYGDSRPAAGLSTDVDVYYVYESAAVPKENGSYDFRLSTDTQSYGIEGNAVPKAIRVYHNGSEVPYDENDGYTYDPDTGMLSLHGEYRPDKEGIDGAYKIYSITSGDLKTTVPQNSYIYKVTLEGEEVSEASGPDGDGYLHTGNQIEIIGSARPDVTNTMGYVNMRVEYFDALDIGLDSSSPNDFFNAYCEHEAGSGLLGAEIDPENLAVYLDGQALSADQFSLESSRVVLKADMITLGTGSHSLKVDYRVRHPEEYSPNSFTFQVGANAGDTYNVKIESFDNMLKDTNIICVRNYEDAEKGLQLIDKSLNFILKELGNAGAVENRLEHISANLSSIEENTISALSRIQDADMAKEAMNLVRYQILAQSQQAMAAQINKSGEEVLALLK